ncbi:MAG: glycosyltransferase, partial [Lachnospiraceae bacterium]|nr:glycosyltransferase [Lachnospiraceae bacterium]
MSSSKISIIVPIYKVESYLRQCLDSILHQTYQNLEIILVDDGSPDGCGAICEEYAQKDSRIHVIHQANKGVSAARNTGLEAATGQWIGWVDPDDWIDADMFELLITEGEQQEKPMDIVICGGYEEYRHRQVSFGWPCRQQLDRREALQGLLEDRYMHNALYDKLWRRELYDGIRFPVGHTYEDLAVIYRLYERADRFLCLTDRKYHYRQHPYGIMGDSSLKNRLDHCL